MVYLTIILIATILLPLLAVYMVMDVMSVTAAQHREESRFRAHEEE
jgi:hypothetical protein